MAFPQLVCLMRQRPHPKTQVWQWEFLVARETRGLQSRLNFIGGKRDAKEETPFDTALREFREETAYSYEEPAPENLQSKTRDHLVMREVEDCFANHIRFPHCEIVGFVWNSETKFCLVFAKCSDNGPDIPKNVTWTHEVDEILWLSLPELQQADIWHPFAETMMHQFITGFKNI